MPLFSAFVLWQSREVLKKIEWRPSTWGLPIIVFSLMMLLVGTFGAELFLSRVSLILLIAGALIFFVGWEMFRAVLFPLCFLLLMIPIPAIVFSQITLPLQMLASKLAAGTLPICGVPVLREGNIINLPAMPLEVAQACSGIRSLMSLMTLAIMYGYLVERRIWVRVALALAVDSDCGGGQRVADRGDGIDRPVLGSRKKPKVFSIFSRDGWFSSFPCCCYSRCIALFMFLQRRSECQHEMAIYQRTGADGSSRAAVARA